MSTKTAHASRPARATSARQTSVCLLRAHGRTFAEELGLDLKGDAPSAWFRLLCFALLCSTRIGTSIALNAARRLSAAGWRDARSMARSTWEQRVAVLDEAGYVRYDFRTATRLGHLAQKVLEDYAGDLRRLREAASHDPTRERQLLERFVGIGPVGAAVFLREAQTAWPELRPYVDERTRETAVRLGLPSDPNRLAALVRTRDLSRLTAALVRYRIAHRPNRGARGVQPVAPPSPTRTATPPRVEGVGP